MKRFSFILLTTLVTATLARAAEINIPKPSGNLTLQIGHPSTISLYDVPTQMTHERLNSQGWSVKSVEFTRTDFNTQALSQGTVQIALSQVLDPVRVIQGGGKLVFLMENNGGEFVLITKREIKDCKELDGKKFAIHGDTATTSLAAKLWLLNECKINPQVIIVPGGENRIIALQNNQIDGTLVQMADWLNLDAQAPGKFHIIDTGGLFNISGMGIWGNSDWLAKNEAVATAYIAETLKTFRMIHAKSKNHGDGSRKICARYGQEGHRARHQGLSRGREGLAAKRRRYRYFGRYDQILHRQRRAETGNRCKTIRQSKNPRWCPENNGKGSRKPLGPKAEGNTMRKVHRISTAILFTMVLRAPLSLAADAVPAKPGDIKVPKPSGNLTLKIGHPSAIGVYDVPTEMTHERLNKQGSEN